MRDTMAIAEELRDWRLTVSRCRVCRPERCRQDGCEPTSEETRGAAIHFEVEPRPERCGGWAVPMLDKGRDPDLTMDGLERSCSSGILVLLEAPNHGDTYDPNKGYLTIDPDTDETGKFTRRLLKSIDWDPDQVVFANAVQCLPRRRGGRFAVAQAQRASCRVHLRMLIHLLCPRVVLAFGQDALRELHRIEPIRLDGRPLRIGEIKMAEMAGRPIRGWAGTTLLGLYHPSPLVRANASRKDGRRGSGCGVGAQIEHIQVVRELLGPACTYRATR